MLTIDTVDFTDNLNSQLMQLTRFKILELKDCFRFFVLQGSVVNQVKYLFLFLVSVFHTRTIHNKFEIFSYFNRSVHKLKE